MFKRIVLAIAFVGALAIGAGLPNTGSAHWRDDDCHWDHRPVVVYPPIVVGGYYPARYYVGYPYWEPYGGYYGRPYYGGPSYGYYGSGVRVSVGW